MPEIQSGTTLAAVVYEASASSEADRILCDVASGLIDRGFRLAGTIQRANERADRCACDMIVRDLATGNELKISQDRGPHARGCRLDAHALEILVGATTVALESDVDFLIVNKFGKQESAGSGFRDAIGFAAMRRIPTLVAVNITYIEAWRAFASGFSDELTADCKAIEAWLEPRLPVLRVPLASEPVRAAVAR